MMRAGLVARCIALFSMTFIPSVYAEANEKYTFGSGMEYFSGSYGTTQHTDILYVPVTGKVQGRDWSLKMTLPYLEITGTSSVVNGFGQMVVPATTSRRVRSGWGDANLNASQNVYNGGSTGFMINLAGKVKIATGNASRGLSTGKNDYALEASVFKASERLNPFATVGYKVYGSPAAYALNNVFYASLGASYKLSQDTNAGAMLVAGQKIMANRSARSELLLFGSHTLDKNWKLRGYLLKGFTTSVPDWGGGILVDYIFENKKNVQGVVSQGYSDA